MRWWMAHAAAPALSALHRWTARLPFPLLEPLALGALLSLFRRRRLWMTAVIFSIYMLFWYPAYWMNPQGAYPEPEACQLEQQCLELIRALDASPLHFDSPYSQAGSVAGLHTAVVKPARYPEWMRAMGISGMFSPWTGEVIVDPGISPALLPFTCVHELEHLKGVADEGAANIAAYRDCVSHGGMFADSARLWALRYALPRLRALDAEAADRVALHMDARLTQCLGGTEWTPALPHPLARILGIARQTTDYPLLTDWLCTQKTPVE